MRRDRQVVLVVSCRISEPNQGKDSPAQGEKKNRWGELDIWSVWLHEPECSIGLQPEDSICRGEALLEEMLDSRTRSGNVQDEPKAGKQGSAQRTMKSRQKDTETSLHVLPLA